jgi:hypothetical protein
VPKILLFALILFPTIAAAQTRAQPTDTFPLDQVITQVNLALNDYQLAAAASEKDSSPKAQKLPELKSADFDFKTTNDTSNGITFTFLVFTIGGTRSSENVNDVTFHYQVPGGVTIPEANVHGGKAPRLLRDDLTKTIKAAAATLEDAPDLKGLPFQQLAITISYGVKWDVKAGVNVPMLVTSGFNFEKSRNAVQSVKLTFNEK